MKTAEVGMEKKLPVKQQNVIKAQERFLSLVAEGKSEREAFLNSLSVVTEKQNLKTDVFQCKANAFEAAPKIAKSINPKDLEVWLELLGKAIPILTACVTFIMGTVDKIIDMINKNKAKDKPEQPEQNKPVVEPAEA